MPAAQVCWLDQDVYDLDSYLTCVEAKLSDDCHDATCAKMSDTGAPCPGDAVSRSPLGKKLTKLIYLSMPKIDV